MEVKTMKTAEDVLNRKTRAPIISVTPETTIAKAINTMVDANIGAILVEIKGEIVGIWSERDLLKSIGQPNFDPHSAIIGDHMKTDLHCAAHDTPLIKLEEMFLGLYIRHIVIKKEARFVGLLSIGDVVRASLVEKDKQLKELNTIASWQYYEDWGWDKKKSGP
jgi:signal-transduction protein with cAMP-binding, CBS, and nucleotidyltransferase domain